MLTAEIASYARAYGAIRRVERTEGTGHGTTDPLRQPADDRSPAYSVVLSPGARDLSAESPAASRGSSREATFSDASRNQGSVVQGSTETGPSECKTCSNRMYRDVSNDSTVSFQAPTQLSPGAAESMVRAHEQEHVNHEQVSARENGRKVVTQSVAIHYGVCPECGRPFVSGGTTTTVTSEKEPVPSTVTEGQNSLSVRV
jgi:hypothetical protein